MLSSGAFQSTIYQGPSTFLWAWESHRPYLEAPQLSGIGLLQPKPA
jgi:hypothetical protein